MRVSGIKDTSFAVSARSGSPRVFLRFGWQRYAATVDEAVELARQLSAAIDAVHKGVDYVEVSKPESWQRNEDGNDS